MKKQKFSTQKRYHYLRTLSDGCFSKVNLIHLIMDLVEDSVDLLDNGCGNNLDLDHELLRVIHRRYKDADKGS